MAARAAPSNSLAAHAADDVARLAGAAEHPRAHHVLVEREAVRRQRRGCLLEQGLRLALERPAALGFDRERDEALAREIERLLPHGVSPLIPAAG